MTHSPPVPPGNQSPYPLAEKPHDKAAAPDAAATKAKPKDRDATDKKVRNGIAAALGIGAVAALIAGIVTASRRPAPPRKGGRSKKNKS